ncbi:unnamed protein product [Heligmosomoides polygyrus]|uniref:EGF-like domain-containing protein n=1 Tax=Heligmosomoides polygyrus TaxID=6339 RepID=A0A183FYD6_HELPZ|nr:unnamed protein product [Heligmosomoides polygyrus]
MSTEHCSRRRHRRTMMFCPKHKRTLPNAFLGLKRIVISSCSDNALLCEQLCITLSPETYECGCWNDHLLQSNGISCKVIASQQETATTTEATVGTTRLKRDRTVWPREKDTAPLSFTGNNFAEFPISDAPYLETNITIEFRCAAGVVSWLCSAQQRKNVKDDT